MVGIRSFPIGEAYFQGQAVSFREGNWFIFGWVNHEVIRSWSNFIATENTTEKTPQMVVNCKGNPRNFQENLGRGEIL